MRSGGRDEFSSLQSRSSLPVAAECARGAGRGASVFLSAPGGGALGPERVRAGLRGRRSSRLRAGADGEGVVVRLRAGGDLVAAVGAAGAGRPGVPLFGGRSEPRPLDAERVSAASPAGDQRSVHPGAGGGGRGGGAKLRRQGRRWQQQCDAADPNETPGTALDAKEKQAVEARLAEIPRRLEKLRKAGLTKGSRADPARR